MYFCPHISFRHKNHSELFFLILDNMYIKSEKESVDIGKASKVCLFGDSDT